MVDKSPDEIRANCALGDRCECVNAEKPWNCTNWARSALKFPAYVHGSGHFGPSSKQVESSMRERAEKHAKHHAETEKRLRAIRHSDPRKHLRAKGVKL